MRKFTLRSAVGALGAAAILTGVGLAAVVTQPAAAAVTTVFDLNGTYTDGGSARLVITNANDILTVDMSSQSRPNAHGVVVNGDTIIVTFPDDATYGAKLRSPGTIAWSNGSAWRKVTLVSVPDVVGMDSTDAVATLRARGFFVTQTHPIDCDADGTVTSQSPAAGTQAPEGSTVTIRVPRPPVKTTLCP